MCSTEVIVQMSGKAYLRWTEGGGDSGSSVYTNEKEYFKFPVILLQSTCYIFIGFYSFMIENDNSQIYKMRNW